VYEETLTGHDTSVQKLPVTMKMWMQFNFMPSYDAMYETDIRLSDMRTASKNMTKCAMVQIEMKQLDHDCDN